MFSKFHEKQILCFYKESSNFYEQPDKLNSEKWFNSVFSSKTNYFVSQLK